MPSGFTTAYDIQAAGGIQLPTSSDWTIPLTCIAISTAALAVLVAMLLGQKIASRIASPLLAFATVGVLFPSYFVVDHLDRTGMDAKVRAGKSVTVQGCVTDFGTNLGHSDSARDTSANEAWFIGGDEFAYRTNSLRPGYHRIEADGGVVHKDEYLRVTYVVTPIFHRKQIMKIEVGSQRCDRSSPT